MATPCTAGLSWPPLTSQLGNGGHFGLRAGDVGEVLLAAAAAVEAHVAVAGGAEGWIGDAGLLGWVGEQIAGDALCLIQPTFRLGLLVDRANRQHIGAVLDVVDGD